MRRWLAVMVLLLAAAPVAAAPSAEPSPVPPGRILLDTSMSMKGFVKASQDGLQTIHLKIRDVLGEMGLTPFDIGLLGEKSQPAFVPGDKLTEYHRSPAKSQATLLARYNALESRLSSALAAFPPDAPLTADDRRPSSALDGTALTVLITDGVEVTGPGSREANETAAGCTAGTDPACLRRVLAQRAREGYGISMIMVPLAFDGAVYAEQQVAPGAFAEVEAHVRSLNADPGWSAFAKDRPMKAGGLTRGSKALSASYYTYTGIRPLMLVILAKDPATGRKFHRRLMARFKEAGLGPVPAWIHDVDLTLGYPGKLGFGTPVEDPAIENETGGSFKSAPVYQPGIGWQVALVIPRMGHFALRLDYGVRAASEDGIPLKPASCLTLAPGIALEPQVAPDIVRMTASPRGDGVTLDIHPLQITTKTTEFRVNLRATPQFRPDKRAWWWEWHSPETWKRPELMYGLGELIDGIFAEITPAAATLHDRVIITVERE